MYNEFKSVIAQRLVVDEVLPITKIGEQVHEVAEEISEEERKRRIEAALHAGAGVRGADTSEIDKKAAGFATSQIDYIYEQPPEELFRSLLPRYISVQLFPRHAGIRGSRACCPHDGHGFGYQQRLRHD